MSAQRFLFGFPFAITEAKVRARPSWQPLGVGCGGGVNTGGALVLLHRLGIRPDIIWFADTGARSEVDENGHPTEGENPETYQWMDDYLRPWLRKVGFPDITLVVNESPNAGHKSLYDECMTNGVLPGRAYGNAGCTVKWKIQPQQTWLKTWPPFLDAQAHGDQPIKVLGYDAGAKELARAFGQKDGDKFVRFWYPLIEHEVDRPDCAALIESAGMPIPPGSSCWYCPNMEPDEVMRLHDTRPQLFWKGVAMERNARARGGLQDGIKGLGRDWSWESLLAMTQVQRSKLAKAVKACMTCAVDSACGVED